MAEKKNITFVRLDILENFAFWLDYEERNDFEAAGREVIAQAKALARQKLGFNERADQLLKEAIEFQSKKIEAGRKGGQSRAKNAGEKKTPEPPKPPKQPKRIPWPTKEQVYDFAHDHNLDEADARNWFEQNYVSRPGCHKDGEVITNWKGSLTNHCKKEKAKREQQ